MIKYNEYVHYSQLHHYEYSIRLVEKVELNINCRLSNIYVANLIERIYNQPERCMVSRRMFQCYYYEHTIK